MLDITVDAFYSDCHRVEFIKSNLQLMFLRVHMEIALLLLLVFLLSWLDSDVDASSWSGREQRGLFINTNVSSSEHVTQRRKKGRDLICHIQQVYM